MTLTHKITLAAIAAICVLVIAVNVLTSDSKPQSAPVAVVTPTEPLTVPATDAGETISTTGPSVVLGPRLTEASGLEDLVSEIRNQASQRENDVNASDVASASTSHDDSSPSTSLAEGSDSALSRTGESDLRQGEKATVTAPPPFDYGNTQTPSLTLGPAPVASSSSTSTTIAERDDESEFADIPAEIELPPVSESTADATTQSFPETGDSTARVEPPALPDLKVVPPADPPGSVAPSVPPPSFAKANEPVDNAGPPPAKANLPAAAEFSAKSTSRTNSTPPSAPPAGDMVVPCCAPRIEPSPPKAGGTYVVQPGDTFSSIAIVAYGAERHWIEIADANPDIDPKRLKVGQTVKLPNLGQAAEPDTAAKAETPRTTETPKRVERAEQANAAEKIHEVQPGENLSSISRKHFNTADHWRHIYLTNRETIGGDPGKLQAGMKLKITPLPAE